MGSTTKQLTSNDEQLVRYQLVVLRCECAIYVSANNNLFINLFWVLKSVFRYMRQIIIPYFVLKLVGLDISADLLELGHEVEPPIAWRHPMIRQKIVTLDS